MSGNSETTTGRASPGTPGDVPVARDRGMRRDFFGTPSLVMTLERPLRLTPWEGLGPVFGPLDVAVSIEALDHQSHARVRDQRFPSHTTGAAFAVQVVDHGPCLLPDRCSMAVDSPPMPITNA